MSLMRLPVYVALLALVMASTASAAFLLEVDVDGADDGVLTYNSRFSFGGDTTSASQSAPSTAFGMTGGDSIFGGDGTLLPDTYVYNYSPGADADNLVVPAGTDLGEDLAGNTVFGTGVTGGGAGDYYVYATWPSTTNVTGGDTRYVVNTPGDFFSVDVDQNMRGDEWYLLGTISFSGVGSISVTQQPTVQNSFVSMRSAGLLFEPVPEPAVAVLFALAGLGLLCFRK